MKWLSPMHIGEVAYDVITLILYFNAISEDSSEDDQAAVGNL